MDKVSQSDNAAIENTELDLTGDIMVASYAHAYLYTYTSFKKRIHLSAQQLFDLYLSKYNSTSFKNTLTVERLTHILEHSRLSIAKFTDLNYVGYAFADGFSREV